MMNEEMRPHPERKLPVMVEAVPQLTPGRMYFDELQALYHGTLYMDLYKPMDGFDRLPEPRRADEKQGWYLVLQDMILYMDTHVLDEEMRAELRQMVQMARQKGCQDHLLERCEYMLNQKTDDK